MRNLKSLEFNPTMEEIVSILCDKTQNTDKQFFRIMFSYYMTKVASMMRVNVAIPGIGKLPVNMYAINLAPSGSGKGRSINIVEESIIDGFKDNFLNKAFVHSSTKNIADLAIKRANKNNTDPADEEKQLREEFENAGPMVFGFDSGTSAAVKQMRHKLLLANSGSMNLEIDEIGSNLLGNIDVLDSFLELFDVGKIKQKLVKHTRDNVRADELFGSTPTNMLLFGTPSKLLNLSKTEEQFNDMLETGFARRCFFGFSQPKPGDKKYTAEEIYDIFTDSNSDNLLLMLGSTLSSLADPINLNSTLKMPKDVVLELFDYRLHCNEKADSYSEFEDTRKAEVKHRYFKVAKLAGVYAFIDQSMVITEEHLYQAIALAEESGKAFERILRRDRPYVKLAQYICTIGREVTHADLVEDLPFFKGTEAQKREMMTLAIAHGYKTNQIIKKEKVDGIEFMTGSSLPENDLSQCIVSYSADLARAYCNMKGKWENLEKLCTSSGYHWVNHQLGEHVDHVGEGGYRDEQHIVPGFNLVVLDIDDSISLESAKMLIEQHMFFWHTTKRHTEENNRFRLVLPLTHILELDAAEYTEFMRNIAAWAPFDVDSSTFQRARKWETFPGEYGYNDGKLLDALQFIPKTKKAEEHKAKIATQTSLTNLERWFVNNTEEGNRNNQLLKFAFAQVDMGYDLDSIKNNVLMLNSKIDSPLPEAEILSTVLISTNKKIIQRDNNTV